MTKLIVAFCNFTNAPKSAGTRFSAVGLVKNDPCLRIKNSKKYDFFNIAVSYCDNIVGVELKQGIRYFSLTSECIIFTYCVAVDESTGTPYSCAPAQKTTNNF